MRQTPIFASCIALAVLAAVSSSTSVERDQVSDEYTLLIKVVDQDGAAVADASVEATSRDRVLALTRTDATGLARLHFPATASVQNVIALKAGVGFDYLTWADRPRLAREMHPEIAFALDGARRAEVRAVDVDRAAVAGMRFAPWMIFKPGHAVAANLTASHIAASMTDENGIARFDWLPKDVNPDLCSTFILQSPGFYWANAPEDAITASGDVRIVATLQPTVLLRGTITLPDGRFAYDIEVQAEGMGESVHPWRNRTRTKLDGSYELALAPNHTYTITAVGGIWAAARHGVVVPDVESVRHIDLTLSEAGRISGQITRTEGEPVEGELVLLGMLKPNVDANLENVRDYWTKFGELAIQHVTFTDHDGRYAFQVPLGQYLISSLVFDRPGGIHSPRQVRVEFGAHGVQIDFSKRGRAVLGNSAAPYKATLHEVYEYAFRPASTTSIAAACRQCHQPAMGFVDDGK